MLKDIIETDQSQEKDLHHRDHQQKDNVLRAEDLQESPGRGLEST